MDCIYVRIYVPCGLYIAVFVFMLSECMCACLGSTGARALASYAVYGGVGSYLSSSFSFSMEKRCLGLLYCLALVYNPLREMV